MSQLLVCVAKTTGAGFGGVTQSYQAGTGGGGGGGWNSNGGTFGTGAAAGSWVSGINGGEGKCAGGFGGGGGATGGRQCCYSYWFAAAGGGGYSGELSIEILMLVI